MRVALIAPPFIPVPPKVYGGTELFIAELALGLKKRGFEVVLYTNGEATIDVEKRWLYETSQWPIKGEIYDNLKDLNHSSWAAADAAGSDFDVVHVNNVPALVTSRFLDLPYVYTIHHPHLPGLTQVYEYFPRVHFVTISEFQQSQETMPDIRTVHHGLRLNLYRLQQRKQQYLTFLGRIAPIKGTHLAIEAAKKAGIPLKIAGEVQPLFRDYYEAQVKPHIDGKFIEYVGEANLEEKNELLGNSLALLFPIQWDEPFGLVMIEAMACGTPVLALPGGSVPEIVKDGVSGYLCANVDEMAQRARSLEITPSTVRRYVEQHFSIERMVDDYVALYQECAGEKPEAKQTGGSARHRAIA